MKRKFFYLLPLLALWGCGTPSYKDTSLSPEQRAELLLKKLTVEEKISLMMDSSKPVDSLGIKPYNWWNEALHGVARAGLATVFPQPIGMAASFSPETVYDVFAAVSDEARAKNTHYASEGSYGRYEGLTFWTPTVNILRDPRWGRGIETYGEDPYLTSRMGVMVVKGLQGVNDGKYDKLHACAKHFAVHSGPEWNRHSFNAEHIKPRDLYETYLVPFEALVKEGDVKEVMCAYNRLEGEPCCGNKQLLAYILREEWGFEGIVLSDCGAIDNFYRKDRHETHPDAASASAAAVLSGTDLECGSSYQSLMEALAKGLIDEAALDVSVKRLLTARFALGEMDDPAEVSWSKIPYSVVASAAHDSLALRIARESMTLLLNKDNALPLKRGGLTVAVMGPNASDSVMQWGNYNGTPPHTITILDGIRNALGANDRLIYEPGCDRVEHTLQQSIFDQCSRGDEKGFAGLYWNNTTRDGGPIVIVPNITTPFRYCTSGATAFEAGVNLTDFSATYASTLTPQQSGEAVFDMYVCGSGRLRINDEVVKEFRNSHGSRGVNYTMNVEKGKKYNIELEFEYLQNDAQLNFDICFKQPVNIQRSVAAVKDADVVVFVSGISPSLEGEEMGVNLPGFRGGDRTDIELPAVQRELITALYRAGKKVILVNCSGSPIGFEPEMQTCQAILQAWYPGQQGGRAVADVLFGDYNPAGRLPVTFYRNVAQLPDFEDYNMTNRTYRYMTQKPLFPFGYGLSYTTFAFGKPVLAKTELAVGESATVTIPVTNTGKRNGEEVVQLYLHKQGDAEGPQKTLRAFKRVSIPAGQTVNVSLTLNEKELMWWNNATNTVCGTPGVYDVLIGSDSSNEALQGCTLTIK
ncbi:MAG: glycoside hydrolase family 3 C-terminal domain-containing protein [Prevotellaceae bacterium]|jgi:beta-glucosidase|nr:glycoside hydrolase family 3 C-terminal domain-containing protein [Prevotellaceae bacterium]